VSKERRVIDCTSFYASVPTLLLVFSLKSGRLVSLTAPPCLFSNTTNAHDSGSGKVTVGECSHDSMGVLDCRLVHKLVHGTAFDSTILTTCILRDLTDVDSPGPVCEGDMRCRSRLSNIDLPISHPFHKRQLILFASDVTIWEQRQVFAGTVKLDRHVESADPRAFVFKRSGCFVFEPILFPSQTASETVMTSSCF
jgi:hypothetical protein